MRQLRSPRIDLFESCQRLLLVALVVIAAGMPVANAADKVTVKGRISTSEDLNPDYRGRPSPVTLIIFQLKSADAYQNADFFSLYAPDSGPLGGDLIARSQRMLQPGQSFDIEEQFDEEARFIGVVAAFRDIEHAEWRGLVELPQKGFFKKVFSRSKLLIELQSLAVVAKVE